LGGGEKWFREGWNAKMEECPSNARDSLTGKEETNGGPVTERGGTDIPQLHPN